jgi:predicted transcriptional regulator
MARTLPNDITAERALSWPTWLGVGQNRRIEGGQSEMRGFGGLEAVVMQHLWGLDSPATVRSVLDELQATRPLAYTTVLTVMDNLHSKGFLDRERAGRAHVYWPTRSRAEYAAELMREALTDSGDANAALLRFVEQMPADEVARLRLLLRDQGSRSGSKRQSG